MPIESSQPLTHTSYYVQKRKAKRLLLKQISQLIHWESVIHVLEKYYPTGQPGRGRKAYSALVLLEMILLQTWYNLSDYGIEHQVNDTLSFIRSCALRLKDDVPDYSVVGRFRKTLNESEAWEVLLQHINTQLVGMAYW